MKQVNKIIALAAIFSLSLNSGVSASDLGVDDITVIDQNTLSVTLSENPNLEVGQIEGEVSVLNDVKLRGGFLSEEDSSMVEVVLENPLLSNTSYSLLSVSGSEGSIDFTTGDYVEGFTQANLGSSDDQDIDFIEILDDRTISVKYKQDLTSNIFEYKLLAESEIIMIEKPDYYLAELIITLDPPLQSNEDYILMFIDIQDIEGKYLDFDTGIYDFSTSEIEMQEENVIMEINEDNQQEENMENEILEVIEIDENTGEGEAIEGNIDLDAAGDEISLEKDSDAGMDVLEAASMTTQTPDTGAQTWVLIALTLVINSFYYLSRRKRKVMSV